jgi:hypothetical protein
LFLGYSEAKWTTISLPLYYPAHEKEAFISLVAGWVQVENLHPQVTGKGALISPIAGEGTTAVDSSR